MDLVLKFYFIAQLVTNSQQHTPKTTHENHLIVDLFDKIVELEHHQWVANR